MNHNLIVLLLILLVVSFALAGGGGMSWMQLPGQPHDLQREEYKKLKREMKKENKKH